MAERLQQAGRSCDWAQQVKHMAASGASRAKGPPKVLQDRKGEHVYSPEVVLARFSEHFAGVLGGGRDLADEVREQLDAIVREVEGVMVVEARGTGVGEEPSLAGVQACVLSLRDVVAPSEDDIIAPFLKACPEGIAWLHPVILAVWKTGRAPVAWK